MNMTVTAAMQIYDFLCHTVFLYIYPLSIQLSHCHIYPQSTIISPLILLYFKVGKFSFRNISS